MASAEHRDVYHCVSLQSCDLCAWSFMYVSGGEDLPELNSRDNVASGYHHDSLTLVECRRVPFGGSYESRQDNAVDET